MLQIGCPGEREYLKIFQDKAETSGNRPEWTKGTGGVSHLMEKQFGCGRCSRPTLQFAPICGGTQSNTLTGMNDF